LLAVKRSRERATRQRREKSGGGSRREWLGIARVCREK
jgi:hypothetical protein